MTPRVRTFSSYWFNPELLFFSKVAFSSVRVHVATAVSVCGLSVILSVCRLFIPFNCLTNNTILLFRSVNAVDHYVFTFVQNKFV